MVRASIIGALLLLAPLARAQEKERKEIRPETLQVLLQSLVDGRALDPRQVGAARQLEPGRLSSVLRIEGVNHELPSRVNLVVTLQAVPASWPYGTSTDLAAARVRLDSGAYQLAPEPWHGKLLPPARYHVRVELVMDAQPADLKRVLAAQLGLRDESWIVATRDVRLGDAKDEVRFHEEEYDAHATWVRWSSDRLRELEGAPGQDHAARAAFDERFQRELNEGRDRFRRWADRLVFSPAWPVRQVLEECLRLLNQARDARFANDVETLELKRATLRAALGRALELIRANRSPRAARDDAEREERRRADDARAGGRPARLDLGGTTLEVQLPPGFERRKLGKTAALVGPGASGAIVYGHVSLTGLDPREAWSLLQGLFPDGHLRRVQQGGQSFFVVDLPIDGRDLALRRAYLRHGEGHVLWFLVAAPAKQGFEEATQGLESVMGRARLAPGAPADPEPEVRKDEEEERAASAEHGQLRQLVDGLPDVGQRIRDAAARRRERGPTHVTDVPWAGPSVREGAATTTSLTAPSLLRAAEPRPRAAPAPVFVPAHPPAPDESDEPWALAMLGAIAVIAVLGALAGGLRRGPAAR